MRMRGRARWAAVAVSCALLTAGCGQQASSSTDSAQKRAERAAKVSVGTIIGLRAPGITLTTIRGETLDLAALEGKVVLVNFWATWCGPCLMEMPSMQRLYEKFRGDSFEIIAISSDFDGALSVKPYIERLQLTFPVLLDPRLNVNNTYKITGIPTTVIIDRDGIITHKIFGSRDWDTPDSHKLISQLLRSRA